ncbi:MAG: hypothetical protein M0006_16065, partial [Magnetospirillum sp.]|nr:hypothetical protein [Magnetospirillum sp.]
GAYVGDIAAFADPKALGSYLIPAHATTLAPPAAGTNQIAVWADGAWMLEADWRGWSGYEPDGTPVRIGAIGQAPDPTWSATPPPPNLAQAWAAYQAKAQALLAKSDITLLRCLETGVPVPAAWAVYRKSLRAIIGAATGDPTQALPVLPAYPAGT